MFIIYKHTCRTTGKSYIGLTSKTIEERWRRHFTIAKQQLSLQPFQYAIRKHGINDWDHVIIETHIPSLEEACDAEVFWIKWYDTYEHGYNATKGGNVPPKAKTGRRWKQSRPRSAEHTAKIEAAKARNKNPRPI